MARVVATAPILIAVAAIAILISGSGTSYTLHAEFYDSGQLVSGDLVTVAGHPVGSVTGLSLTPNGLAQVDMRLTDPGIVPLHTGTFATIGQLSLSGVANRYVALTPGPDDKPRLPDGATLTTSSTRGIVDLDAVLDALDPRTRKAIQQGLAGGSYVAAPPADRQANRAFAYLNPALSRLADVGRQLVTDRAALSTLLSATAAVSKALAQRSGELAGALTNTAAALRQIAAQRAALSDSLARLPPVLAQADHVLGDTQSTLAVLNPALAEIQPLAPRLARLLRTIGPVARNALPAIAGVQALIPAAVRALEGFPPVERLATPAIHSLTAALGPVLPVLADIRPYAPDVIAGFFNGVGGDAGGYYDANGHYVRVGVAGGPAGVSTILSLLGQTLSSAPGASDVKTGYTARCPGAGTSPAPDRSNPWVTDVPGVCNLSQTMP